MDEETASRLQNQTEAPMTQQIFLLAGEKSGDLIGSRLIHSLKNSLPSLSFVGVGGQEMREAGLKGFLKTEEFEIHGFSEVIRSFRKLKRQFQEVLDQILTTQPQAVILIDYPGFNLRLAKALKQKGFKGKIIQYVSPTIWAWGPRRKETMVQTLDLLLTIYPFEPAYFNDTTLSVKYVGNPIYEIVKSHVYDENWAALFGIHAQEQLIALFPGSRKNEIRLNLPYLLNACEQLKKEHPEAVFVVSCAHEKIIPLMHPLLRCYSLKLNHDLFLLPKNYAYELMRDCRTAIAKSGTVTLELALHERPTIVIYKLSLFNRFIAKFLLKLKLPFYCIVNIICGKRVYPELIDKGLNRKNLFSYFQQLNNDTEERKHCIQECQKLPDILEDRKASDEAASAIKELLGW
jgi:lipid-A-disaccharide synthase